MYRLGLALLCVSAWAGEYLGSDASLRQVVDSHDGARRPSPSVNPLRRVVAIRGDYLP